MFHGNTLYAVYDRNVGTFGGRAEASTLKIYRTSDCGRALVEISGIPATNYHEVLCALKRRNDRCAIQDYLAEQVAA